MNIGIITNEYPPYNYGGAGVHVEYLTRELARLDHGAHKVKVLCFGDQWHESPTLSVKGVTAPSPVNAHDPRHVKFLDTILRDIVMAGDLRDIDLVKTFL